MPSNTTSTIPTTTTSTTTTTTTTASTATTTPLSLPLQRSSASNGHVLVVDTVALRKLSLKSNLSRVSNENPASRSSSTSSGSTSSGSTLGLLTPPDSPLPRPNSASIQIPTAAASGGAKEITKKSENEKDKLNDSVVGGDVGGGRVGISDPVPWNRFKELVDSGNLEPLGRSYKMQDIYEEHLASTKCKYGSLANYLTRHVLPGLVAETEDPDFDPLAPLTPADFVFCINDYPYYLDDDVEHWVLWCKKRLPPGFEAPDAAVQAIVRKFGSAVEWRYFVNPVKKQSVPQLSHAHVFVKRGVNPNNI